MTPTSVLLTTDGTFPCYPGGVTTWCDQLLRQLSDLRFHVFAVTYSPSHTPSFCLPSNVESLRLLPLWGTEEPGPQEGSLSSILLRKARTSTDTIRSRFLDPFGCCVRSVLCPASRPEQMAEALFALHIYFQEFDYPRTMSSPETWELFLRICRDTYPPDNRPSLDEATTCMRWVQRYLAVAAVHHPDVDIVHASMAGLAGIPGVIQKLKRGSRFLLSEHGIFLRELYLSLAGMKQGALCRRFLFSWYETIARVNYTYADAVSSLCEFNRKWQARVGAAPEKIRIIPNGVDPATFRPPDPPRAEQLGRARTVLTMARIFPLKGIDHLLRAARLVLDRMPDVRFRILGGIGDPRYHRHCLDLAEQLGISKSLEWGQTPDPASAYQSADVFCLPSISEAMPYSVLEAMFSGCPVVATEVGGVSEMLAGTGLVVPPKDAESMARAILSLLEGEGASSYRQDLACRALAHAQSSYTIEKSSGRFRELYDQLSGQTRPAHLLTAR
ncbi:MAG: GT4 family glycosyltransferase PelF [Bryobacteraceae bacterium]